MTNETIQEIGFITELEVSYRHKRDHAVGRANIDKVDKRLVQLASIKKKLEVYEKTKDGLNQINLF